MTNRNKMKNAAEAAQCAANRSGKTFYVVQTGARSFAFGTGIALSMDRDGGKFGYGDAIYTAKPQTESA